MSALHPQSIDAQRAVKNKEKLVRKSIETVYAHRALAKWAQVRTFHMGKKTVYPS